MSSCVGAVQGKGPKSTEWLGHCALIKELKVDKPSLHPRPALAPLPAPPRPTSIASATSQNAAACPTLVAVRNPPILHTPFASFPRPALRHAFTLHQQHGRGLVQVARRPIPVLFHSIRLVHLLAQTLPRLENVAAGRLAALDFAPHRIRAFVRAHWLSQTLLGFFRLARCLSPILLGLFRASHIDAFLLQPTTEALV